MESLKRKAAAIALIKDFFAEMCSSRRTLKPILADIVKALDDNLFIDADSDEVKTLLNRIVEMQSHLTEIDELKSAAATGSIVKIESAIETLDTRNTVNQMKAVLARFKELHCHSSNEAELEATTKMQRQAHRLLVKADKMSVADFIAESRKFEAFAERIDNAAPLPPDAYTEFNRIFADNSMIVYSLMNRSLSLSGEPPIEPTIETKPKSSSSSRAKPFDKLIKQCEESITAILSHDVSLSIESAGVKKQMSFKSFNNKLRNFITGSEVDFYPVLRSLSSGRIFSITDIDELKGYNSNPVSPIVCDKLFQWGTVDKVHWDGLSFYYLNDHGRELLYRFLPTKDNRIATRKLYQTTVQHSLRRFMLLTLLNAIDPDTWKHHIDGDPDCCWLRFQSNVGDRVEIMITLALMLFEPEWPEYIRKCLANVDMAINTGDDLKAVFLITTLDFDSIAAWLRMFKRTSTKNVFALCISEHSIDYRDIDGDPITREQLSAYIQTDQFHKFADYKSKYIKPSSRRSRKKVSDDESTTKSSTKTSTRTRRKKTDVAPIEPLFDPSDDQTTAPSAEPIADLFFDDLSDAPRTVSSDAPSTSLVPSSETSIVPSTETSIVPSSETAIVPSSETAIVPSSETSLATVLTVDTPLVLPPEDTVDDQTFDRVELRVQKSGLLQNAIVLFMRGSAARGMLELKVLCFCAACDKEMNLNSINWFGGLTNLISCVLDEPSPKPNGFVPFDFCEEFFDRESPLPELDADYLRGFFMAALIIRQSYSPEMSAIFELRARQNRILSDKTNAALRLCPSIKRLITLFKNFTEQTNAPYSASLHADHAKVQAQFDAAMELISTARQRADSLLRKQVKHPRSKGLIRQLYDTDGNIRQLLAVESVPLERIADFCRSFTSENSLEEISIASDDVFSNQKVGAYIDGIWDDVKVDSHKNEKFTGVERMNQINALTKILTALLAYVLAKQKLDALTSSLDSLTSSSTEEVLDILHRIEDECSSVPHTNLNAIGPEMLRLFIQNLEAMIEDRARPPFYRECLLGAKYIELRSDGLPEFDNLGADRYSLVWRVFDYERAIDGLSLEDAVNAAYETAVRTYDCGMLERIESNYRAQLSRADDELKKIHEAVDSQVGRRLEILYQDFLDKLALDRHYSRLINPNDIDYYLTAIETAKTHFVETRDAGLFERFIDALNVSIARTTQIYADELRARVSKLEDEGLRNFITNMIDINRLSVAEDYLNDEHTNHDNIKFFTNEDLVDFLKSYEAIFNVCAKTKQESLEKVLIMMKRELRGELGEFVSAWQNPQTKRTTLLEYFFFDADFEKDSRLIFVQYQQPLDKLIEQISTPDQRINLTLCLLNFALSLADRRKLTQSMKLRADLSNVIVIDRVMVVYLTQFDRSERQSRMLHMITPFASVNPFAVQDLFVGREHELELLSDLKGPCFLVGGPMTGKSALLDQLVFFGNDPFAGSLVLRTTTLDGLAEFRDNLLALINAEYVQKLIVIFDINKHFATIKGTELEFLESFRGRYRKKFKYIVTAYHGSTLNDSIKLLPLDVAAAMHMAADPLCTLGFASTNECFMRGIFAQTNYYAGLLMRYCSQLIDSIADNYNQRNLDATRNPPYDLNDEFLKHMLRAHPMSEPPLATLLRERGGYYYTIMLVFAYARFEDDSPTDVDKFREICILYDIDELADMNDELLDMLLDEMVELNLLRRAGERYVLYRRAYQFLFGGTVDEIAARLTACSPSHRVVNS